MMLWFRGIGDLGRELEHGADGDGSVEREGVEGEELDVSVDERGCTEGEDRRRWVSGNIRDKSWSRKKEGDVPEAIHASS